MKPAHPTRTRNRPPNHAKRVRWFVIGVLVSGLVVSALFWRREESFAINGVPFRTWVAQRPDFDIQDPLASVGTNAVPHLIKILHRPSEPVWVYRMKERLWKGLPSFLQSRFQTLRPVPEWQLKRTALFGLRFLGREAKPALPEVLRFGRGEKNVMVRAGALVAALQIAPESPDTFGFWLEEWKRTNYFSRHDLAIYLRAARYPVRVAIPFLLTEAENNSKSVAVLEAFEFFGDAARPAVPYMLRVFDHGTY